MQCWVDERLSGKGWQCISPVWDARKINFMLKCITSVGELSSIGKENSTV